MSEKYKLYSSKTTHLASSGNILATYNKSADVETPNQTEYSIYGSSRLGTQTYTAEELNEYEYSNTIQTIIEPITFRQNSIISINGVPFVGGNFSYNFQVDDEIVLSSGETFTLSSNFSTEYNNNILFITCDIIKTIGSENISSNNTKGRKTYELSNHLGNVQVVVSDKRKGQDTNGDNKADFYFADVTSAQDLYPFGMQIPGRSFSPLNYRYGYNTQERSDELHQNHYTAKFWEYDSRVVKRWNIDPEFQKYSSQSPYVINHNNPIVNTDPYGDDPWSAIIGMAVDYGIQVTANVITREKGDTWGDILYKKVDFVDVAVSGVQGLVLGPVAVTNSLRKKVAVVVGGELVKAMYSDAGIERKEDGTINTKKIATDFTISLVTGYAADVSGDKLIKVSKTAINQAENLLVKAEKKYAEKVVNGTTNSATKWTKEAVENAKTNLTKANGGVGSSINSKVTWKGIAVGYTPTPAMPGTRFGLKWGFAKYSYLWK